VVLHPERLCGNVEVSLVSLQQVEQALVCGQQRKKKSLTDRATKEVFNVREFHMLQQACVCNATGCAPACYLPW
jgi:hypothetical protein